jgi:alpha,alpha-trehalase
VKTLRTKKPRIIMANLRVVSKSLLQEIPDEPTITSPVFGYEPLVDTIQKARLFKDSKMFVDLKVKVNVRPSDLEQNFEALMKETPQPTKERLKQFLKGNFHLDADAGFDEWDPPDWSQVPSLMAKVKEKSLRYILAEVHVLWKVLSKTTSVDIRANPSISTLLWLPNGFIIPGGRFRETVRWKIVYNRFTPVNNFIFRLKYYWDTYWVVRGLLLSDMFTTVKGILENFLYQVETFGFVPNGTRTYYLVYGNILLSKQIWDIIILIFLQHRSQPPYLISMILKYAEKTGDWTFVERAMPLLEKELNFFEEKRSLVYEWEGQSYKVFRYGANSRGPRPESYVEDMELAEHFKTDREKEEFFLHIKSAAESGWDFSSRWMITKEGGNEGTLLDAKTNLILPVDLNSLMYKNYNHMSDFHERFGNELEAVIFRDKAIDLLNAITAIFWDPTEEMWFDLDMINGKRRCYYYASNLFPLWAEAYPVEQRDQVARAAINYLDREEVNNLPGGLPTSKMKSGQQWDFNCWPPMQHMIVSGLNKTRDPHGQAMAFKIAKTYVEATSASCPPMSQPMQKNQKIKEKACAFFEKYDPNKSGNAGGGGEYDVQLGFGWTNGVLIDFISIYGDMLVTHDKLE